MIPEVIVCGDGCGEALSFEGGLGLTAGVRRVGFRFVRTPAGGREMFRRVSTWGLALFTEGGGGHYVVLPAQDGLYLIYAESGPPPVADYPAPPAPYLSGGEFRWTRFIGGDYVSGGRYLGVYALLPGGGVALVPDSGGSPPVLLSLDEGISYITAAMLSIRYKGECANEYKRKNYTIQDIGEVCKPPINTVYHGADPRFPGSGRLTGEEFRIVEPDADYLRLVGRGGDEYIAWDFVLGTLDTGEWVLMGEDGLYTAVREGGRVVVREPYGGSLVDVRGPPKAYTYPVVPTRMFKHAREYGANVVEDTTLLKWPLNVAGAGVFDPVLGPPIYVDLDHCMCLRCKTYRRFGH